MGSNIQTANSTALADNDALSGQAFQDPEPATPVRKAKRASGFLGLLRQNRKASLGAGIIVFFLTMAIIGPWVAPYDPTEIVGRRHEAPSSEFWFGTDGSGKDVFSQTIVGARLSLATGLIVGVIVTLVAIIVGMSAGYFRGKVDDILTTITNVVLIIPGLPLLIVLAAFLPAGFWSIVFVLAVTGWAWGARVYRSQTLSLREKDFVASAVVAGESKARIILREILPNMMSIVVAGFLGAVNYAIGAQAGLEFLGLGNSSNISWGTNLYWAQNNGALLLGAWWTLIPSGLSIALVAFGFSMINYAIDEVTNPRLRSQRQTAEILKGQPRKIRASRATPVIHDSEK
ncbi:MAG TPA: ABC transporter permease [Thermomicrobiales bacterium]|jgi:peptide/nickel transport system permease protein|nr:ABC transporter permease [Thermomicrobiales bacterium]